MSILTKIFVVALVVLSLLLSAATITFVNSIDDYKRTNTSLENQLAAAKANAAAESARMTAEAATLRESASVATTRADSLEARLRAAESKISDAGVQLASANSDKTIADANVSKLTAAVSASEVSKQQLLTQVADLRSTNARLQTQNGDLNVALADSSNKLVITEEARRVATEQLTETRTQLDRVGSALKDRGVDPARLTTGGLAAGAPAINGVIRATQQISGIPHAKISVGSDDAVKVGMEFNILNSANGQFLGKLRVVAVEPNEAIGQITGPNPQLVAAGAEVRTQL